MPDYLLPKFSKTAIEAYIKDNKTNANLLFYRYLHGVSTKNADEGDTTYETLKNHFIKKASASMSKALLVRHEAFLRQWEDDYGKGSVYEKPLELTGRMVVGMGISSSFENGLLLHWTHGIPYINGEALKGAARSFAKEGHRDDDNFSKEEFKDIFGSFNKEKAEEKPEDILRGKVVFFDAFPEPVNEFFNVDIITSHYGPYYTPVDNSNDPAYLPGDWHMPNPVAFLTVKEGLIFRFAVASIDESLAKRAWEWLETALIRRGVGAKKHIGYGHFMPGKNIESEFNIFMTRLNNIRSQMLIGSVSELVNALEKINDIKERQKGAQELTKRIGRKKLDQKSDKEWAKKLKDFLLE
ncbi:MAG: type III-B CRISPR module RAMP protein Cmr6 [Deltaproteobacteria bacterium]|nr:MAG: type III-B CRISPR module RAMP protein Cmr6 [Deltaproteobacteria bacterium]